MAGPGRTIGRGEGEQLNGERTPCDIPGCGKHAAKFFSGAPIDPKLPPKEWRPNRWLALCKEHLPRPLSPITFFREITYEEYVAAKAHDGV